MKCFTLQSLGIVRQRSSFRIQVSSRQKTSARERTCAGHVQVHAASPPAVTRTRTADVPYAHTSSVNSGVSFRVQLATFELPGITLSRVATAGFDTGTVHFSPRTRQHVESPRAPSAVANSEAKIQSLMSFAVLCQQSDCLLAVSFN